MAKEEYIGFQYFDIWADEELCEVFDWVNMRWNDKEYWYATMSIGLAFCAGARRMDLVGRPGRPKEGLKVNHCRINGVPQLVLPHSKGRRRNGGHGKLRFVDIVPEFGPKFKQRIEILRGLKRQYVFEDRITIGQSISSRTLNEIWEASFKEMGVRNFFINENDKKVPMGIRAARRTFATYSRLLRYRDEEGEVHQIRLEDLQAQMGHSQITTTAAYYLKSLPGFRWVPKKLEWPRHI